MPGRAQTGWRSRRRLRKPAACARATPPWPQVVLAMEPLVEPAQEAEEAAEVPTPLAPHTVIPHANKRGAVWRWTKTQKQQLEEVPGSPPLMRLPPSPMDCL